MTIILDANVLLRFYDKNCGQHADAAAAIARIEDRGDSLRTFPQSFHEFWVVGTRPISANGFGMEPNECGRIVRGLVRLYPLLSDRDLFENWLQLVSAHACRGKIAHDARYAAAMRTHGLTHLMTFNVADFARFPGIVVLDPAIVAASVQPK